MHVSTHMTGVCLHARAPLRARSRRFYGVVVLASLWCRRSFYYCNDDTGASTFHMPKPVCARPEHAWQMNVRVQSACTMLLLQA